MNPNHFILTLIITLGLYIQPASGQSTVTVSSTGIGEIKINMDLAQVEKVTGQRISLSQTPKKGYEMDTVLVTYKDIPITIVFNTISDDENNKLQKKVYNVNASHPTLQTKSGITLGNDKFDIVKKLDGMYLTLQPDWRMQEKPDKAKYSILMLTDGDNGTLLIMYFENNKLTGFEISVDEGC